MVIKHSTILNWRMKHNQKEDLAFQRILIELQLDLDNYHHNYKLIEVEAFGMTLKESYNPSIHCRMAKKKNCMCLMNCNSVDPDNIDQCQSLSSRGLNHFLVEVVEAVNISEKFVDVY